MIKTPFFKVAKEHNLSDSKITTTFIMWFKQEVTQICLPQAEGDDDPEDYAEIDEFISIQMQTFVNSIMLELVTRINYEALNGQMVLLLSRYQKFINDCSLRFAGL